MSVLVYQAINAVAADLSNRGVAKRHRSEQGDYQYRSIEDVLNALAPLLARHKLCALPRVVHREAVRCGPQGAAQLVSVRVAFDLVSALDGSTHRIESFGEAIDDSDKGTAKAISAAYKSAMLQTFCIPVPQEDTDSNSPRLNGTAVPEPPEGWVNWAGEVIHIATTCDSTEAIDRLRTSRRPMLGALQRERPDLYVKVGEAIAATAKKLDGSRRSQSSKSARATRARRAQQRGIADAPSEAAEAA